MCAMRVKVVVHEAEEGGFWAEVPALPGCVSQGETMDELLANTARRSRPGSRRRRRRRPLMTAVDEGEWSS